MKYVLSEKTLSLPYNKFMDWLNESNAKSSSKARYMRDYRRYSKSGKIERKTEAQHYIETGITQENYRYKTIVRIAGKDGDGNFIEAHKAISFPTKTFITPQIKKYILNALCNEFPFYKLWKSIRIDPVVTYDQMTGERTRF